MIRGLKSVACSFGFVLCAIAGAQQTEFVLPNSSPTLEMTVLGNDPACDFATWQDTGLMLRRDDVLYIAADGAAQWNDQDSEAKFGPAGSGDAGPQPDSILMPGISFMALVGMVGSEPIGPLATEPIQGAGYVGPEIRWKKTSEGEGRLYLGINDGQDSDNSGGYRARIWIERGGEILDASVRRPLNPVPPIATTETMGGQTIFHGAYKHYARGREFDGPVEVRVNRMDDGSIRALGHISFFNETTYATGDASHRPVTFAMARGRLGQLPPFAAHVEFRGGTAIQSKCAPGDVLENAEYTIANDALFDYNARPDSYVLPNILLRRFALADGNAQEWTVCDWGNGAEGLGSFPTYRVRLEYKGVDAVAVPAGRFQAHRILWTQLTGADTWYKKQAGHLTEFWVLDNYVIVRLVRHREPYEVQLAAAEGVESLPGYEGESTIVPVFIQRHDHQQHAQPDAHHHHEEHQH